MVMLPVASGKRSRQAISHYVQHQVHLREVRTGERRQGGCGRVCGSAMHAHLVRQPDLALRHERVEHGHACNEPRVEYGGEEVFRTQLCTPIRACSGRKQPHRWSQLRQCAPV
jgi:hypothetical protein